jgi:glutamate--cysteine ligase
LELSRSIFSGNWGIEREVLRVDGQGRLSRHPHPFPPGHKKITVDYAEAQAELITGVHPDPGSALEELEVLHDELEASLGEDLLWPLSVPGIWTEQENVASARFADDPEWEDQRRYRRSLELHHGGARQILSGIHVNYSFGPQHPEGDYFSLARNFLRYQPVLTYLLAASPWLDAAYRADLSRQRSPDLAKSAERCGPWTSSVRQSPLGYSLPPRLEQNMDVRFDSLDEYLTKLKRALLPRDGHPALLGHEREFYASVRPKGAAQEKGRTLEALARDGVGYLEFRIFDLDPLAPLGIRRESLLFFELFLAACTILPSPLLLPQEIRRTQRLGDTLAQCSLGKGHGAPARVRTLWNTLNPVLKELADIAGEEHLKILQEFRAQIEGKALRIVDRVASQWKGRSPLEWGLARARLHKAWRGLELSTRLLIEEADRRGISVNLLDASDNFLLLEKDGRQEYVKQATRTLHLGSHYGKQRGDQTTSAWRGAFCPAGKGVFLHGSGLRRTIRFLREKDGCETEFHQFWGGCDDS